MKIFFQRFFVVVFWVSLFRGGFTKNFLKGPPSLLSDKTTQKKTVSEGKDVKLTCPAEGTPEPIIEWSKGGEAIPSDSWERYRTSKASLKIKEVVVEDQGKYMCKAVNGFGSVQFTFYLTVLATRGNILISPSVDELRLDQVFPVSGSSLRKVTGQNVRFKCVASGDPTPEITWLKDGHVLEPSSAIDGDSFSADPGLNPAGAVMRHSLPLTRLRPRDSGNYSCLATNIHGAVMANWTLNVVGKMLPEGAEVFPLEMPNVTTYAGESTTLTCRGAWDSNIQPKVMWLRQIKEESIHLLPKNQTFPYKGKHYQVLQPTELILLENGLFMSKLVIQEVKKEDSGLYVCTVSNRFGVNVKQANLTVLDSGVEGGPILLVSGLAMGVVVIAVVAVSISICRRKSKPSAPPGPTERALIPSSMAPGHAKLQPAPSSRQPRYIIHPPPNIRAHAMQTRSEGSGPIPYSTNVVHVAPPHGKETPIGGKEQQPIIIYQDPNLAGSVYLASHQTSQPQTQPPTKFEYRQFDVI